ncbi:MAG: CPBP family intramembrane metalloprotease [Clostridiales bacterium]|nr:CPBP family intramembrane metalloprotease [Clostridiales bacterium]
MTKLYRRNELAFALIWIVAYVVLTSVGDQVSAEVGVAKSVTAAVHAAMSCALYLWIRRNGLMVKYGLCRSTVPHRRFLYYIPLAVIASASLWSGIGLRMTAVETALYVISMCLVGFLEEVIFRGLLFRAIARDDERRAVVISSVTFGLGHIVNLFRGVGQGLADTLAQIVFAVLVGFTLVLIFLRSGSLMPCIVFHSLNNALGAFATASAFGRQTELMLNLALMVVVLGGYLLYLIKAFPNGSETRT